ncbi:MAG TPA: FAD-dependent oxidoreductase [Ilumatobacteraceae bacterium]
MPDPDFDVVVVGAGPAGSCAAIEAARGGLRTLLLERGPYPGSKNMYGGVVYPRILDELIPQWWTDVPIQRWVTRRSTMVLTETKALSVDVRNDAWAAPPYNGATAYRPDFDRWLADHAVAAGATLLCNTTVSGLLRDSTRRSAGRSGAKVMGVHTDRPDGDVTASVVIACDGVNSFVAKEAGLYGTPNAKNFTLGVKETISLPKHVIDERFGVRDREGVDIEVIGCTGGVNGGGFVYTNLETVAVGVVLKLTQLAAQKTRPEDIIASMKRHSAIAPLIDGGELDEYSAHLIPEAGLSMMPEMTGNGLLIAGDAAALCLAAGIWLEGVNFAMASGMYAGQTVVGAIGNGDVSQRGLGGYARRLSDTFVLRDHRKLRRAPELVLSDRVQHMYPSMVTSIAERMFRVDNPAAKPGLRRIFREERKAAGVHLRDLISDGRSAFRSFG